MVAGAAAGLPDGARRQRGNLPVPRALRKRTVPEGAVPGTEVTHSPPLAANALLLCLLLYVWAPYLPLVTLCAFLSDRSGSPHYPGEVTL